MITTPQVQVLELIKPYEDMVRDLFKVGKELGNEYGNLMHAAIGMAGEAGELFVAKDRGNIMEECGDMEFYFQAALMVGPVFEKEDGGMPPFPLTAAIHMLTVNSLELLDVVKKGWVYNKKLDIKRYSTHMHVQRHCLNVLYHHLGVDRNAVIWLNQQKLIGPNGRYPDGRYSDAAAQARADKGGAQH